MSANLKTAVAAVSLALAGCVSVPTGPSVTVLPGTGRSFEEFRYDEGQCRQYAYDSIGGQTATVAQQNSAVTSAVVGTAIGAAAGAAFGGSSGAAAGAGVGLIGGSLAGSSAGYASGYESQRRYDIAFTQCMYGKGHRVPVARGYAPQYQQYSAPQYSSPQYSVPPPPPPSARPPVYSAPPPPPPGTPPPPPPGA